MTLLWGVRPILCSKLATTEQMIETAERLLEEAGYVKPREIVGIVAGTRTKSGSTNFLRLHVLGDNLSEPRQTHSVKEPAHPRAKRGAKAKAAPERRARVARSGR